MSNAQARRFRAPYETAAKVVTLAAVAVMLGAGIAIGAAIRNIGVPLVDALVIALAYAYSPRGYAIEDGSIVIRRLRGGVRFPLESIRQARAAEAGELDGCLRLWGSGGLFGYYGLFQNSKLGTMRWYVTNRNRAVVLLTDSKPVVISPENSEEFLAAVRAQGVASGPAASASPSTAHAGALGVIIGCGVAVAAVIIVTLALLYSPGAPTYTLTSKSLAIHDRFYPVTLDAGTVNVAGIRVVDLETDPDWRPTARTNGFANSHYRSGWFRVSSGRQVRLYDAGAKRVVLIPPKDPGPAVLLEMRMPDGFVKELREKWGGAY